MEERKYGFNINEVVKVSIAESSTTRTMKRS